MGRRARDALRTLGECEPTIGFLLFELFCNAEISVSFGYVLGSASKSRTPLSPRRARGLRLCSTRDANATLYVVWPVLGEQHPSSADEEHT